MNDYSTADIDERLLVIYKRVYGRLRMDTDRKFLREVTKKLLK